MSTSLLYHSFGIRGYDYCRTSYEQGATIFTIEQKRETLRCSRCGSADVQRRGEVVRRYQHLPIGPKPVFIELAVARIACPHCGVIRQVPVPFVLGNSEDARSLMMELGVLQPRIGSDGDP